MAAWTADEVRLLRDAYGADRQAPMDLRALAVRLGRRKSCVCRKAQALGLTNAHRYKIPGGKQKRPTKFATKEALRMAQSERQRRYLRDHGHPRGALGLRHTEEARKQMSRAIRLSWLDPRSGHNSATAAQKRSDNLLAFRVEFPARGGYSNRSGGKRADLGNRYFRSSWEANYARFLQWLQARGDILSWEYEPHTFVFESIKRGTRSYTPDFKVLFPNHRHQWHEVKGWMDAKSRVRLERMQTFFPQETIVVIDEAWFRQARRSGLDGLIAHWEHKRKF